MNKTSKVAGKKTLTKIFNSTVLGDTYSTHNKTSKGKKIVFDIEPMGKPRMVRSDAWSGRECIARYWKYKDDLNMLAKSQKYKPDYNLDIKFYLSMPKSWSDKKKKMMDGECHLLKPDFDNLVKAFTDSLMENDSMLHDVRIRKYWARKGHIEIMI